MSSQPNNELTAEFARLIRAAAPDIADVERTLEFAGRLAGFTESWAADATDLDAQQEAIEEWITSAAEAGARLKAKTAAAAVEARPKARGAAAGAGSGTRRRPAKKR